MDRVTLTGAELSFLVSTGAQAPRRRALERLRLAGSADTETTVHDGLSSLVARGLTRGVGPDLTLSAPMASITYGLTESTLWAEVSAVQRDAADTAQLYVHDRGAFLLSPRAYGTFEVRGVRAGLDPLELLVSVARSALGDRRPSLVACRIETSGSGGVAALASRSDGTWAIAADGSHFEPPVPTLEDGLRSFRSVLMSIAPVTVTA